MKIQKQPDYLIFADSAKNGEVEGFPDIPRGWGITIDRTESKPPMEWMNGAFQRIDQNILYLLQQGIPEWRENVTYPANAIIKYRGILYTATSENENANPESSSKWKQTHDSVSNATHTQAGVVKLSSAVDSTSETEAATPKAVKTVSDNVNNAHNRITDVNNNVTKIADKFQPLDFESVVFSPDKKYHATVRNDGVFGFFDSNSVHQNLSWAVDKTGGLVHGYVNVDKIRGLDDFINEFIPVGIPMPWPQIYPPAGWLECNGSTFDKNKFPKLAAAYPSGMLPDLRGVFVRGVDNGRGLDPDRVILSFQEDAIRNITGTFGFESAVGGKTGSPQISGAFYVLPDADRKHLSSGTTGENSTVVLDASRVVPVAHENRPRNVAFMYIVKAE